MRKIAAWLFISLDGITEAPERWVMFNEQMGRLIDAEAAAADTLLLGRRTYEVFAAAWPDRSTEDDPMADWMNNTPKLVVSTTLPAADWNNSTVIKGDVAQELNTLKQQPGGNISVNGSATLVRSLLRERVLDQLRLVIHPIVLGHGERLFDGNGEQLTLGLADAQTLDNGVLSVVYQPATRYLDA